MLYYYDQRTQLDQMEITNLLQHQPECLGRTRSFLDDCAKGNLPEYSFVEPNYNDHDSDSAPKLRTISIRTMTLGGELFIASIYNAVKNSPLWPNTALLVVYESHGGIYDHVVAALYAG